jgi:NAD(P)-dependent dehydrogenase (short-subunit alcohol dehydrogenase family)
MFDWFGNLTASTELRVSAQTPLTLTSGRSEEGRSLAYGNTTTPLTIPEGRPIENVFEMRGCSEAEALMKDSNGKIVLITDIDPEIGAEVADRLLRVGATILVTGFQAAEIISKRFEGRPGITDAGVSELTTDTITELFSRIEQDHGGLDVIFTNNHVNPELDAESILDKHAFGMVFTLHKLHPLLHANGAVVVCASFPLEQREKARLIILGATATMRSFAQTWALALEARRIRVNVVSLYMLESDHALNSENFELSASPEPSRSRTRLNTVKEVASTVLDLAVEDSSISGADVVIVNGNAQISQLPPYVESSQLGSPAQIVENVVFLASDLSRPLTGMELFPEGEIRKL